MSLRPDNLKAYREQRVADGKSPSAGPKFAKGTSGNPGGRSSAAAEMARRIRERTGDGLLLIDYALAVLLGTGEMDLPEGFTPPKGTPEGTTKITVPTDNKSRAYVHEWLTDRGWGKPKVDLDILFGHVELTPEQAAMLEALKMSPHERRERIAELRKRLLPETAAEQEPVATQDDDLGRDH